MANACHDPELVHQHGDLDHSTMIVMAHFNARLLVALAITAVDGHGLLPSVLLILGPVIILHTTHKPSVA